MSDQSCESCKLIDSVSKNIIHRHEHFCESCNNNELRIAKALEQIALELRNIKDEVFKHE